MDVNEAHFLLLGDISVMQQCGRDNSLSFDESRQCVSEYSDKWYAGNPYSALRVSDQDGAFVGMLTLTEAIDNEAAEVTIVIRKDMQGRNYGTEVIGAVAKHLAPCLKLLDQKVDGEELKILLATVKKANHSSVWSIQEEFDRGNRNQLKWKKG